jgi:hypothetical protein
MGVYALAVADARDLEAGVIEMRSGINAARALGHELCHSYDLTLLADMLTRSRRYDEALSTLEGTDRLVNLNEKRFCSAMIERLRAQIVDDRGKRSMCARSRRSGFAL